MGRGSDRRIGHRSKMQTTTTKASRRCARTGYLPLAALATELAPAQHVAVPAAPAQLTTLLSNRDLDRLHRLRLNASRRFTNRSRGEHLAAKGGTSTEFCDYRDYSPGDDVRFVDWNIFARTERPYLKQFHQEEEMHVALVIDASNSMEFDGKFEMARRIAAALGAVGLHTNEKVSVCAVGTGEPLRLRASRGRGRVHHLFSFLERLPSGGVVPIDVGIEQFLRGHSGRGVVILLSDFLTPTDPGRAFNLLFSAGLEIFAAQILGPSELAPELTADLRLVDSETASHFDVSAAANVIPIYHEYREAHTTRLAALCRQRGGKFVGVSTADSIESVLFDTMRRNGWLV